MILTKDVLDKNGSSDLSWAATNMQYEVITGSQAYGCQVEGSDYDIYGWCIPPKQYIMPELFGYLPGFSSNIPRFDQLIVKKFPYAKTTAEGQIFNIVRFFRLCADNNPNMIDTLFVRAQCRTHCTYLGDLVHKNRELFLSKKCWHTFKGYAYSQLHKVRTKCPEGSRRAIVEKYGFDVKFAAHIVRLLYEVEQLLEYGDMDLMLHREELKSIRCGEWSLEKVERFFEDKVKHLEAVYETSKLPYSVDEEKLRVLLISCLEEFYGDLSISKNANIADLCNSLTDGVNRLYDIINKYRKG